MLLQRSAQPTTKPIRQPGSFDKQTDPNASRYRRAKLEATSADLDGKDSDIAAVKAAVEAYAATTKTGAYANAKDRTRRAYDKAFQAVALLLVQDKVTQELNRYSSGSADFSRRSWMVRRLTLPILRS